MITTFDSLPLSSIPLLPAPSPVSLPVPLPLHFRFYQLVDDLTAMEEKMGISLSGEAELKKEDLNVFIER